MECKTYQVYLKTTKTRQAQLHQIIATLQRNAYEEKEISKMNDSGWTIAQKKRSRVPTPAGVTSTQPAAKQSIGWLQDSTNAAKDPSQQRIPIVVAPNKTH